MKNQLELHSDLAARRFTRGPGDPLLTAAEVAAMLRSEPPR